MVAGSGCRSLPETAECAKSCSPMYRNFCPLEAGREEDRSICCLGDLRSDPVVRHKGRYTQCTELDGQKVSAVHSR